MPKKTNVTVAQPARASHHSDHVTGPAVLEIRNTMEQASTVILVFRQL